MPRPRKPPRLYLRTSPRSAATWVILDGGAEHRTGFGAGDRAGAEGAFAAYLAAKHAPERRERRLAEIRIADVIAIYARDVLPDLARPAAAAAQAERLLLWWGDRTLDEVTGASCRAYAAARDGQGPDVKGGRRGTGGGARRDLQVLGAAIGHHHREGYHREVVRVVLPPKGEARQRWLTRDEFAKLMHICETTREVQEGRETAKYPLRHVARFLALGVYTGSRPGAALNASWLPGPGRSFVDLDNGVFHRRADGAAETTKRQPTVRLAPELLALLKVWKAEDEARGQTRVVHFDGSPVASVKTGLARAVALAALPAGVTAYTVRHSAASWLMARGVPTRMIADFLGTSEAMILKHYGHLAPDYQERAAMEIGRI
jgi:integrase